MYNDLKNLMSINQHGFMKNRLTIMNLLEYASFVLNSIEDGNQVDSIYTDFSKAFGGTVFDRVSSINDLGVIMDEKMTFSEHVDVMVAKAFAMLGFIRRLSLEFRNPYS
jgi:hypothetical protein